MHVLCDDVCREEHDKLLEEKKEVEGELVTAQRDKTKKNNAITELKAECIARSHSFASGLICLFGN
jgi:hypothetical protein